MPSKLDFIVIGAQKAGTTALWHYLRDHPGLYLAPDKEAPFFSDTDLYERGLESYMKEYFPLAPDNALVGKITPPYMMGEQDSPVPLVVERIRRDLPEVKLVALLRDPVARAISHFRMSQRRGLEDRSFAEAIAAQLQPEAIEAAREHPTESTTYVVGGEYGRILSLYREAFPAGQLLVLSTECLRENPQDTLRKLLTFLSTDQDWPGLESVGGEYFVGGGRRRVSVDAERSLFDHMKKEIYPLVRGDQQDLAARSFGFFFTGWNVVADDALPSLPAELRPKLDQHFEKDGALLRELGYETPWFERSGRVFGAQAPEATTGPPDTVVIERLSTRIRELEIALEASQYRLRDLRRHRGLRGAAYSVFARLAPSGSRRRTWAMAVRRAAMKT